MDAKDILGLPKSASPATPFDKKSARPHKDSHRKPDGVSREVYALTGGLAMPSLMPSVDVSQLKGRSSSANNNEKVTWQWLSFANSARKDNLQLFHWVRVVNGVPPTGDYSFAKYNKPVDIVRYTDEEYEKHLTDPVWTKEETDQLFDLCEQFDLRFIVIADRFTSSRSVEELKDRYYSAARAIVIARASSPGVISGHPLVKEPYNVSHERERKRALSMVLSQTKQQERKDVEVLAEAKRISKLRMSARGAEETEFPAALNIVPESTERDIVLADTGSPSASAQLASTSTSTAAESASVVASLRTLRVYTRTYALDQMVQAVSTSAGLRTIKRVEETLQELGVNLKPKVPTKAVCAEHLELRKEILTLLNLQKQLQYKEAEGSSYRDGSFSETPSTTKRLQRGVDLDSSFLPEPLSFGGDRVGKREQKRKAPGGPSTAAHKRPRKLKASDG